MKKSKVWLKNTESAYVRSWEPLKKLWADMWHLHDGMMATAAQTAETRGGVLENNNEHVLQS